MQMKLLWKYENSAKTTSQISPNFATKQRHGGVIYFFSRCNADSNTLDRRLFIIIIRQFMFLVSHINKHKFILWWKSIYDNNNNACILFSHWRLLWATGKTNGDLF